MARKQKISHGRKKRQKYLPRTNTEFHGNKTKNNHGRLNKRAPSTSSGTGAPPSVWSVSLPNWPISSRKGKISFNISIGARSKGSNGGVAVGLPHRSYSVLKQTPYQLMGSKSGGG
jgi:hypothetical protein